MASEAPAGDEQRQQDGGLGGGTATRGRARTGTRSGAAGHGQRPMEHGRGSRASGRRLRQRAEDALMDRIQRGRGGEGVEAHGVAHERPATD